MSKSKKSDKKKGGGLGKVLFGLVAVVTIAVVGLYFAAPDLLQRGLKLVGMDMPM